MPLSELARAAQPPLKVSHPGTPKTQGKARRSFCDDHTAGKLREFDAHDLPVEVEVRTGDLEVALEFLTGGRSQ